LPDTEINLLLSSDGYWREAS